MATDDAGSNFIASIIAADLASGRHTGVVTRFPPEPNGWPHIGHAKAITVDFELAARFGGRCHLRFDDTNPEGESMEFVEAIQRDVRWLGYDWGEHLYFASDYYERLYQWAEELVTKGLAYVDQSTEEEIRAHRGTVTEPGTPTPYRDRPAAESLDLLRRMRAGEFDEGAMVLRARIDLASPNMKMRDPLMYRIKKAAHYRTGTAWVIYPFYDFAHCLSDAIEGITHSLCTLEFENNRELYDWYLANVTLPCDPPPQQIEFARLELGYTVTSKRKLKQLVETGVVRGWDDPRMPTLAGLRRRGVRPDAIRAFCERLGVAKANSVVDMALFEQIVRDDLNAEAPRVMGVLDPIELVIEDWPEDRVDWLEAPLWPHDVGFDGTRPVPFSRVLLIEREDFEERPPKGFKRLAPGRWVRLLHAYAVECVGVDKDAEGRVIRVRARHDPASRGGETAHKVSGSIHWVSAAHAVGAEVRLVDRLFTVADPGARTGDFLDDLNPDSMRVVQARLEPVLRHADPGSRWQLVRQGYFIVDEGDSAPGAPVLSRIASLKEGWRKAEPAPAPAPEAAPTAPTEASAGERPAPRRPERAAALVGLGVDAEDARVISDDPARDALFEALRAAGAAAPPASKWLLNEILPAAGEREPASLPVGPLAALIGLVDAGRITAKIGREILPEVLRDGADPAAIVARDDLVPIADAGALEALAREVAAAHPAEAARFAAGEQKLLGFFVGQVMKASGGKADARVAREVVARVLAG